MTFPTSLSEGIRTDRRALIVDDEPATCQLIERVLTSVGMASVTITRSDEVPELLRHGRFSLVFFDCEMPFPDGHELTRRMRDTGYNRITPIILISEDQHPRAMTRGFQAGASFFMYKPIDKERLLMIVRATQGTVEHERRRTRRVPIKSRVMLRFAGNVVDGETVNISMEGLLIRSPKVLPVGSSVDVSLQLSGGAGSVAATGSVVRLVGPNQMGIHLGRLSLPESQKLQDFLLPLIQGE